MGQPLKCLFQNNLVKVYGREHKTYELLRDATFAIMDEITREIMRALQEKHYQR